MSVGVPLNTVYWLFVMPKSQMLNNSGVEMKILSIWLYIPGLPLYGKTKLAIWPLCITWHPSLKYTLDLLKRLSSGEQSQRWEGNPSLWFYSLEHAFGWEVVYLNQLSYIQWWKCTWHFSLQFTYGNILWSNSEFGRALKSPSSILKS